MVGNPNKWFVFSSISLLFGRSLPVLYKVVPAHLCGLIQPLLYVLSRTECERTTMSGIELGNMRV